MRAQATIFSALNCYDTGNGKRYGGSMNGNAY